MPVNSKHPLYADMLKDWEQLKDTAAGQRAVKEAGTTYLPATAGMQADGMGTDQPGYKAYQAYKTRATFPEFVSDAIEAMVGLLHKEAAVIELPPAMEPLRENATVDGESLLTLLRRIHEAQFKYGRFGLLVDVPSTASPNVLPYIATYEAQNIINWDSMPKDDGIQDLQLVVLDESGPQRINQLEWEEKKKYRVLIKPSILADMGIEIEGDVPVDAQYAVAVFDDTQELAAGNWVIPSIGGRVMGYIPFVFANTNDMLPQPDKPPLLGLSNRALAVYRSDADYRQALFMQGQDTLVIIGRKQTPGQTEEHRIGAGAFLELPIGGDAKYVGVSGDGLAEQRQALENDKKEAAEQGAKLMDFGDSARQSGDALRIRMASKTASLTGVAKVGAEALQETLRCIADWMGLNREDVKVIPNLKFAEQAMNGEELMKLTTAKSLGAPISRETIHRNMKERGLTTMTYEEEMDAIESEAPLDANANDDDANDRGALDPAPEDEVDPTIDDEADDQEGAN